MEPQLWLVTTTYYQIHLQIFLIENVSVSFCIYVVACCGMLWLWGPSCVCVRARKVMGIWRCDCVTTSQLANRRPTWTSYESHTHLIYVRHKSAHVENIWKYENICLKIMGNPYMCRLILIFHIFPLKIVRVNWGCSYTVHSLFRYTHMNHHEST